MQSFQACLIWDSKCNMMQTDVLSSVKFTHGFIFHCPERQHDLPIADKYGWIVHLPFNFLPSKQGSKKFGTFFQVGNSEPYMMRSYS